MRELDTNMTVAMKMIFGKESLIFRLKYGWVHDVGVKGRLSKPFEALDIQKYRNTDEPEQLKKTNMKATICWGFVLLYLLSLSGIVLQYYYHD